MDSKDIITLLRLAESPDLNSIENLRSILTCYVFKNQRQFFNADELENAILERWNNISLQIVHSLFGFIQRHCLDLTKNGLQRNYYWSVFDT